MKAFLLASILLSGAPLVAETDSSKQTVIVTSEQRFRLGKDVVEKVRTDHQKGLYAEFLKEMNQAYKAAKKENALEGLIEIRTVEMPAPTDKFLNGYSAIQKEKNKALSKAIKGEPESALSDKVRSATTMPNSKEEKALRELLTLRSKAPGTGKNSDENSLIELDLEHAYKAIHLDSLIASGQKITDRQEKQLLLEMVRMEQMAQASASFTDKNLKDAVATAQANFDQRLAKMYDLSDLARLANGQMKPTNGVEEKIAFVLVQANEEMADLHMQTMQSSLLDEETVQN